MYIVKDITVSLLEDSNQALQNELNKLDKKYIIHQVIALTSTWYQIIVSKKEIK